MITIYLLLIAFLYGIYYQYRKGFKSGWFFDIFLNKEYSRGSLYGAGIFPFWIYIKLFGKPFYKIARNLKCNKYFSLMSANLLGSAAHVNFFEKYDSVYTYIGFVGSLFLMTTIFYLFNKFYYK